MGRKFAYDSENFANSTLGFSLTKLVLAYIHFVL